MNQFAIIVGGIALLVIGGGARPYEFEDLPPRPLKNGGDEYTDLNSIGGGDGFHHGEGSK